jgi:hypothetical protein
MQITVSGHSGAIYDVKEHGRADLRAQIESECEYGMLANRSTQFLCHTYRPGEMNSVSTPEEMLSHT